MQAVLQQFLNYISNLGALPAHLSATALDKIRGYYSELSDPQLLSFAYFKMAEQVMRSRALPEPLLALHEQCIFDVIERAVLSEYRVGTEALRCIFDINMEYYKHNNLDPSLRAPLGLNRRLNYYQPEVGEEVDVVKPYITSTSYCAWTRGRLLSIDNKKYTVKYQNTEPLSVTKDLPFFDLLGSRTPDNDWRDALQFGSLLDAYNKVWYPATVVEVGVENGAKRVRVSFRRFSENGKKIDSDGNRYDGLGPNEDDWIDVFSYRIQRPGKMARELCEFSQVSEQQVVDDTYDLLFEKEYESEPFFGIMRCAFTRSLSYLHFYEHFCRAGGNEAFLAALRKRELAIDPCINVMIVLGNTCFLVPRMGLNRFLPALLQEGIDYLKECHKQFNSMRLDAISYFIESLSKRLHSLSRKHIILNDIKKFLCLEFAKLNLEKQMIALKYLSELIRPLRPYQDASQREELHAFLRDNAVFYKFVQSNAHEQVLSRSGDVIRYLLEHAIIGWPEVEFLWNVIPHSDLRGRSTVERLIGEVSKDFSAEFTAKIVDRLLGVRESELTTDKLNLLRVLKDRQLSTDYRVKVLNFLWECLTVKSTNIRQQVEEEVESVFRGFISTVTDCALKLEVLRAILHRLREIASVRSEMYLFKEFILTYPAKLDPQEMQAEGAPRTVGDVVVFLKQERIYETLVRLLGVAKGKEKAESILEFVQFLFEKDQDDISLIVRAIYDILGPSDTFLLWARPLASRALAFFIDMYQRPANMANFEKLSAQGFEAIRSLLLEINLSVGNIRLLRKRKVSMPVHGPHLPGPVSQSVGTSTGDYELLPEKGKAKEETLTFVFVLKSPFECIGVAFLLQLCQFTQASIYNEAIKLVIQFIVNLDDSILSKAAEFQQEFLSMIFRDIADIAARPEIGNSKLQLDIYLNLIQELFSETEKDGLPLRPHFSTIEGDVLRLKVENNIAGNEVSKKEPCLLEVNENTTLWEFKGLLAGIYGEAVGRIDVVKYVHPIEDSHNGKSLSDLHFFNEEGIKVQRREPREVPRHELLSSNGQDLSPRFAAIVEGWFEQYRSGEVLTLEDLRRLSQENWKGSLMKEQGKLQELMARYDTEQRGGLTLTQFRDFFWRKAVENSSLVWRLLNLAGFLNNLRHKEDQSPVVAPCYPRKILSSRIVYDSIYKILSNEAFQPVHLNFYKLLTMLQSDQELCRIAKSDIRHFLENEKSIHRLSYGLESLITELEGSVAFYREFYEHGGLQEIAGKLELFFQDPEKSVYAFDTSLKSIVIPNLLKILNLYLYPFASHHRLVRFAKKVRINHLDLPEIVKKLEQPQSYAEELPEKRAILLARPPNAEQLYRLALSILQNITKNFNTEYLVKASHEVIRLFGYVSFAVAGFDPEHILNCANSGSLNIRRSSHALIYMHLAEQPQLAQEYLTKLTANIPAEVKYSSNTYFELLKSVLEKALEGEEGEQTTAFFTNLALQFLEIFFRSPGEQRQSFSSSRILEGILLNLLVILTRRPAICRFLKHFKQELIACLFFYSPKERIAEVAVTEEMLLNPSQPELFAGYVKCKSEATRKLLMEVLFQLYRESGEGREEFFGRYIVPVLAELPDSTRKTAARFMHVGLNNLGSTCYLNSMVQVLNSIDAFRNAVMMADLKAPLIHELKALFSYLFFSERLDYVPRDFLNAFSPPINPAIQQDTTEFLNFLFDQLEPLLKDSPYRRLLEELFKGSQVAQMICHSCGAKRERLETFFSYSVEIEGKYDLLSALDGMHAGELISDCLCESCGTRSDTTKRNVLSELPNIFFVHLKRIVFNYDIFMNTKIHTRLYFPEELDVEPFTKEGLELRESLGVEYMKSLKDNEEEQKRFAELALHGRSKEHYRLRLKGIIVHSGTPDVGHYYAILKRNNNWVKFDDSRVSSFPTAFFEEECFGGTCIADEWGGSASSKNAYVLIYEKDLKRDIELEEVQQDGAVAKRLVPEKDLKTYNTAEWYREVWLDNHSLMVEQHLTGENYTKDFLHFVCRMLELAPSPATLETISEVFFKISALSGEVGSLLDIFSKNLHLVNADVLERYVLADPKRTFGVLFHQQPKIRDFASCYLSQVLIECYRREEGVRPKVVLFIQEYLSSLHGEVAKNWLRIDGYFKMFERLVEASPEFPELYLLFVSSDLITYFIDFILEKQSPLNLYQKKYSLGTKSNPVSFGSGLATVLFLLRRSFGFVGNNYEEPPVDPRLLFHLSDNAVTCLSCMPFYEKMIKENQNPEATACIIERLSILHEGFSHAIARVLLKAFNENTDVADECDTVMLCISRFLRIRDFFWPLRAQFVLGSASCYVYEKNVMGSLEEEKYIYPSSLENVFPLESLLSYIHMNRLRVPLTALNMIKTVLEATSVSEEALDFLARQPAPAYTHLRYIDWLRPYINEIPNQLPLTDKKREEVVSKLSLCNLYLDDLYKHIEHRNTPLFVHVLGQVAEKVHVGTMEDALKQARVDFFRVPVFAVESLPNGKGNSAFDKFLENGRLQTQATEDSNILRFFKQSSKPLAIKAKNVEEHEDKEIISLFDEEPYPKKDIPDSSQPTIETDPPKQPEDAPKPQPDLKQPLQPIPEIVPEQINVQGARWQQDYLYCLEVHNNTDVNKLVVINFNQYNVNTPRTIRVMAAKNKEEFWYHKTNPYEPAGKPEHLLTVCDYLEPTKPFFRLYGSQFAQEPQPAPQPEQQKASEKMESEAGKEVEPNLQNFVDAEQVNCPFCTFFNPATNVDCEVCGSPLHQA